MNIYTKRFYDEASGNDAGGGGSGSGAAAPAGGDGGSSLISTPPPAAPATSPASTPPASAPTPLAAQAAPPAQAAGGEAWYVGLYDQTGKLNAAKFDALPAHLKAHKDTFAKYQTVEALLGGFANVSSLAGKKALAQLPPDASPEAKAERAKVMAQLNNVPEKPEGYGFKRPDSIPENMWNGEYVDGVAAILHKHQVSPEAAKELMAFDEAHGLKIGEQSKAAVAQAEAAEVKSLKDAWGTDYAKNIDLAVRGARTLGFEPNDPVFKSAKVVQMVAKFASMISEERLVSGETTANAGMDDRAKGLDIMKNPNNPLYQAYHNPGHPQHAQAVEAKSRFTQSWLAKQQKPGRPM